tara:strand:- start:9 stop:446 length:438 start_codon:yes stop_codon:yes gene_type:complete
MAQSSRETDLNPSTYIGLSFPLRADNNNNFAMTRNSLEQSVHNLKNLLMTNIGERLNQPEFGSKLLGLCFEPDDGSLAEKVDQEVRRAVNRWLSYINILRVDLLTDQQNPNKIFVSISFSTNLNPDVTQTTTLDTGGQGSGGGGY